MQKVCGPTNLSEDRIKAPSAGVCLGFGCRRLFEASISFLCPLVHSFCFKFRGLSLHHKHQLHPHEGEGGHPEKQIPTHTHTHNDKLLFLE